MRVQVCRQANPDPIHWRWSIDRLGRITYSSSAVELLLGFRAEEIIGGHSPQVVHPRHLEPVAPPLSPAPQPEPADVVLRVHRKNGTAHHFESPNTTLLQPTGRTIGCPS